VWEIVAERWAPGKVRVRAVWKAYKTYDQTCPAWYLEVFSPVIAAEGGMGMVLSGEGAASWALVMRRSGVAAGSRPEVRRHTRNKAISRARPTISPTYFKNQGTPAERPLKWKESAAIVEGSIGR
jgi:hypothetical protein